MSFRYSPNDGHLIATSFFFFFFKKKNSGNNRKMNHNLGICRKVSVLVCVWKNKETQNLQMPSCLSFCPMYNNSSKTPDSAKTVMLQVPCSNSPTPTVILGRQLSTPQRISRLNLVEDPRDQAHLLEHSFPLQPEGAR